MEIPNFQFGEVFFQVFGGLNVAKSPGVSYSITDRSNKQCIPLQDDHPYLQCAREVLKKVTNTANSLFRDIYVTVDDFASLMDDGLSECDAVVRNTLNDSLTLTKIALTALAPNLLFCTVEKLGAYANAGSITYYNCSFGGENDFCLPLPT